jgi:hypothetical protein
MKQFLLLSFLISTFILTKVAKAQENQSSLPAISTEDIYRHYTGSIGNRPAVVDFRYGFNGSSNYGGSRHYFADDKEGEALKFYIRQPKSFAHGEELTGNDVNKKEDDIKRNGNHWRINLHADKLTGSYSTRENNFTVDLKEDYSRSVKFDVMSFRDKLQRIVNGDTVIAEELYTGVQPAATVDKKKTDFILKSIYGFLALKEIKAKKLSDYPVKTTEQFFRAFDSKMTDIMTGKAPVMNLARMKMGYYQGIIFMPFYNDNDILVLEEEKYNTLNDSYNDGDRRYLSLDMARLKPITLPDMLNLDEEKLSAMLEEVLRSQFGIQEGQKLDSWLLVNKIPVTRNAYPGHNGIYFTYNPGELRSDKLINIYLPYKTLEPIMKKEFKTRIGM